MPTGTVDGNIRVPKWTDIYASLDTFTYDHATEATAFGLREDGILTIKPHNRFDHNDRFIRNADDVEFKADLMQTGLGALETMIKLSRRKHQLFLASANGDYFNFTKNTGSATSPTGSALLGVKWKASIEKDTRKIEATWHGRLFKKETVWLYANMGTIGGSTGSGAGSVGLSAQSYARLGFRESNFIDVLIGGTSVGNFGDAKIEWETKSMFTDHRNREMCGFLACKAEVTMGQSASAELTDLLSHAELDSNIQFLTPAGETFNFNSGAMTTSPEFTHSDKEANIKVMMQGEVPVTKITFPGSETMTHTFP